VFKRIVTLIAVVCALAAAAVPSAPAQAPLVFCLNGTTITEGDDVIPLLRWLDPSIPEQIGVLPLDEAIAAEIRSIIENQGGTFVVEGEEGPLTEVNTVSEGPCAGGAQHIPRKFLGCYSTFQTDPAPYAEGMTPPYAVMEPVSATSLGNGFYLTCRLPAGYSVKPGAAVSTGFGGPALDSTGTIPGAVPFPAAVIEYLLSASPLDWAKVAVRA
jgi:hypothetical protein